MPYVNYPTKNKHPQEILIYSSDIYSSKIHLDKTCLPSKVSQKDFSENIQVTLLAPSTP